MILIVRTDPATRAVNRIWLDITEDQLKRWHKGEEAEKVFSRLTSDEIEYIVNGVVPFAKENLTASYR